MSELSSKIQEFLYMRERAEKLGLSLAVGDEGFTIEEGRNSVKFYDMMGVEAYLRGFDHGRTKRGK